MRRAQIFTDIYLRRMWRSAESASGSGSEQDKTETVRKGLKKAIQNLGTQILLDAPCGDFNWMQAADLPLKKYIGVDIVSPMIEDNKALYGSSKREFSVCDIVKDELPQADTILCRDCLNHLPLKDGVKALQNFKRSGAEHLIATTFTKWFDNFDIVLDFPPKGWRPLNLEIYPFSLGNPLQIIAEREEESAYGKVLGVWQL